MEKTCSRCKVSRDVSYFHKNSKAKDGLQSQCKHCANESSKWSQGMKRAEMSELKGLLAEGELGFRAGLLDIQREMEAKVRALALRYGKKMEEAVREFKNGATYSKTKERVAGVSVRSSESESVSDNG